MTGNEDGVKHCAMNVLYSLQHLGYVIPPQADAGWIGEAGPGPSYLDPGLGRARERLHEPEHDVHDVEPAARCANAEGRRRLPGARQPALALGRRLPVRLPEPRVPLTATRPATTPACVRHEFAGRPSMDVLRRAARTAGRWRPGVGAHGREGWPGLRRRAHGSALGSADGAPACRRDRRPGAPTGDHVRLSDSHATVWPDGRRERPARSRSPGTSAAAADRDSSPSSPVVEEVARERRPRRPRATRRCPRSRHGPSWDRRRAAGRSRRAHGRAARRCAVATCSSRRRPPVARCGSPPGWRRRAECRRSDGRRRDSRTSPMPRHRPR